MTALTPHEPLDDMAPPEHAGGPAADPQHGTVVDAPLGTGTSPDTGTSPETGNQPWPQGMIPGRRRRRTSVERVAMRLLATGGIIGVAVVIGSVLVAQNVDGWIVGLIVGLTSVSLAAVLWSSKQL